MTTEINIRMYAVGFGDAFLLTFPNGKSMLVDCGFHSSGVGAFKGNELAAKIVEHVTGPGGVPRIDVVVATHRHQDHVYAFNSAAWQAVEVGEVWLPWLEERGNPAASALWKKQKAFADALGAAADSFGLVPDDRAALDWYLWNAGVGAEPGFEAWSNQGALDRLHEGFKRRDRAAPRFLPETGNFPEVFEPAAIPGLRVHVLGPSRDPALIAELDPEKDGETYRALAIAQARAGNATIPAPFGPGWHVRDPAGAHPLDPDERKRVDDLGRTFDPLFAAETVDHMINSTSLVLVLEFGKARMLFPGDAEWGTWKTILGDTDARALLRGCTFLKIGHHGSHNATPKNLVEKVLPDGLPALISTQAGPGNFRNDIPLPGLLDALQAHKHVVTRSDDSAVVANGWVDLKVPC